MTYADFAENAEVETTVIVKVNGVPVWDREYGDLDFVFDDYKKIGGEVEQELRYQYQQLPELIETNEREL